MKLLIISHTPHAHRCGQLVGWGSTIREITQLARVFESVTHVAPLHYDPAPPSFTPYAAPNVHLIPVRPAGGDSLGGKIESLRAAPGYLHAITTAARDADVIHVRCPCNIGLVACLWALMDRQKPRWAKYAGNWRPGGPEPLSYKLQRFWLESGAFGGPVTVNGRWPNQPEHVHSLVNPSFSQKELEQAIASVAGKRLCRPVRLLFAGRLEETKGVLRVVEIATELIRRGLDVIVDLAGDGPDRDRVLSLVERKGLCDAIRLHGWLSREALADLYRACHFVVLPSLSEGWPKVLSEGMAHGAVPVASAVSSIGQVLAETQAGIALPTLDIEAYASAIERLVQNPDEWQRLAERGQEAAAAFTYEVYVERIMRILSAAYPSLRWTGS
jgi:glycosyltransferase involved in cell wall biosynthesis